MHWRGSALARRVSVERSTALNTSAAAEPGRGTVTARLRGSAGGGYASLPIDLARAAAGGTSFAPRSAQFTDLARPSVDTAPPSAKDLAAITIEDPQSNRSGRHCDIRGGDDCGRHIRYPNINFSQSCRSAIRRRASVNSK